MMATPALNSSAAWDALLTSAHAWQFCLRELRGPGVRDRCFSLLSLDERTRLEQIQTAAMREEYLAARALCRSALSRYTGVDPTEWRFMARAHGKPAIAAPGRFGDLRFNLTHTAGLVICIVSRAGEVGVDAEETSQTVDAWLIARHFLSGGQQAQLAALPPPDRISRFFEQWVLKEAYVKAIGKGLAYSPERLTIGQDESGQPIATKNCRFSLHRPSSNHVAAAAVLRRDCTVPISIEWLETHVG